VPVQAELVQLLPTQPLPLQPEPFQVPPVQLVAATDTGRQVDGTHLCP
jgi:hypothetical protein